MTKVTNEEHRPVNPTASGQRILELLCDRLHESGHAYSTSLIGSKQQIVNWLASRMNKSVHSLAGTLSDLIEKGFVCNSWIEVDSAGRIVREDIDISVTPRGWTKWSEWSEDEMRREFGFDLEEWLDWDGIDGMKVGYEFQVRDEKVFECEEFPKLDEQNGAKAILFDTDGSVMVRVMCGLTEYQQAVGGLIERITLKKGLGFYVHDNGRTLGLPVNHRVSAMVGFVVFGPAVMTKTGIDGNPKDVPQKVIDRIAAQGSIK